MAQSNIRQRTRSMSSRVPFHMGYEMYIPPGGSPQYSSNLGTYQGYGNYQTMTDTVGAPPKKGPDGYSYNPMQSRKDIIGGTPCSYSVTLLSNGATWYSSGNPMPGLRGVLRLPTDETMPAITSQGDIDSLQSAAGTACLANRGKGPTNMFENLFQIRKTIDELRNPFRNFALWSDRWVSNYEARVRKVRGSRKTQVKAGVDLPLDTWAAAWLQYRYGIRLLIKDVNEIISRFDNKLARSPSIITTRGVKSLTTSDRFDNGTFPVGVGLWTSSYTIDETIVCRATSHDEYVMDVLEQVGLTGKGLLSVGWELIPYSFVADWFVNISDFLNASIPTPQMRHVGECLSTKRTTTMVARATCVGAVSGYSGTGSTGTHSITTVSYSRGNSLGPGPSLQIQPDFGFDRLTRTADAVALAYGALTRAFGVKGRLALLNLK